MISLEDMSSSQLEALVRMAGEELICRSEPPRGQVVTTSGHWRMSC